MAFGHMIVFNGLLVVCLIVITACVELINVVYCYHEPHCLYVPINKI